MVPRLHRYLGGASGNEVTESFMVAGGYGLGDDITTLAYSYDGINWIKSTSGTSLFAGCYKVAYNGSMWLACGDYYRNNVVGYSLDGINWTASEIKWTADSFVSVLRGINTVATNGSIWLCGGWDFDSEGEYALIGYSSDGITWTASESARSVFGVGEEAVCDQIAWNGSIWLATGYRLSPEINVIIAHSSDGITWTASQSTGAYCTGMAWNGIMWVLSGSFDLIYSYNGNNWAASANGNSLIHPESGCMSVATNGSMWVAGSRSLGVRGGNSLVYSYDGINWTASANGNSIFTVCYSVAWNGTRWVAGGRNMNISSTEVMAYSTDGITWTRCANSFGTGFWSTLVSRHVLPYTVPLCKRVNGTNSCVIEDTKYRILE